MPARLACWMFFKSCASFTLYVRARQARQESFLPGISHTDQWAYHEPSLGMNTLNTESYLSYNISLWSEPTFADPISFFTSPELFYISIVPGHGPSLAQLQHHSLLPSFLFPSGGQGCCFSSSSFFALSFLSKQPPNLQLAQHQEGYKDTGLRREAGQSFSLD